MSQNESLNRVEINAVPQMYKRFTKPKGEFFMFSHFFKFWR